MPRGQCLLVLGCVMVWVDDYTSCGFAWLDEWPCEHLTNVASFFYATTAPCVTLYQGFLPIMDKLHLTMDASWRRNGQLSYFCESLWDLGRETMSRKRRAECWAADRVGFTFFHLVIWVPFLGCVCFWFRVLAYKVPGSFGNSCKNSLTLRAPLTDNAWN